MVSPAFITHGAHLGQLLQPSIKPRIDLVEVFIYKMARDCGYISPFRFR